MLPIQLCRQFVMLGFVFFLTGCYHYEYRIVSPPDFQRRIFADRELVVHRDPMEYRFLAEQDLLVIRIFNPTQEPIQLLGQQSSVVDPHGQSHPLLGQVIPPGAYIKLILPPMPRYEVVSAPHASVGFGFGYGFHHHGYYGGWYAPIWYDPGWDEPRYVAVYEPGQSYWRWDGPGDVRLILTLQRGPNQPVTHDWSFVRVKVSG
jgi:hypothetical protein